MKKPTVCPQCDHEFEVTAEGPSGAVPSTQSPPDPSAQAPPDPSTQSYSVPPLLHGAPASLTEKARRGRAGSGRAGSGRVGSGRVGSGRTPRGLLFRGVALGVLLIAVALAIWTSSSVSHSPKLAESPATFPLSSTPASSPESAMRAAPQATGSMSQATGPTPRTMGAALDRIEKAIVEIQSDGPGDLDSQGTGFVIDPSGLVATSYHVISEHTQARVRFKNGATHEIVGYVAVRPEADLAIVQIGGVTDRLPSVRLRHEDDPQRLASVITVGHPHGLKFSPYDGKVSRVVTTSQLPSHSRRFLRQMMQGSLDHRWIQHTARISGGNSGGPLVNDRGEVIGINTWVDQQTGFSYALHARHLRELWRAGLAEPMPLSKFARKEARVAQTLRQLTAERVERLAERARAMRWQPESSADYETLQQLAWAVTVAQLPGTLAEGQGIDAARMNALQDVTDRIAQTLRSQTWDEPGQVTIVNEFAIRHVGRPMAGLFFFGTVQRIVEGDDGTRAVLMQLAGTDQMLFLPLEGQLVRLEPGASYLVLGVNYDGHVVRYGDNPLKLIAADVIASRTILPLQ